MPQGCRCENVHSKLRCQALVMCLQNRLWNSEKALFDRIWCRCVFVQMIRIDIEEIITCFYVM